MPFNEMFCNAATGSNLNAGSTTDAAAIFTHTNGGWDSTTGVFTAAGANLSGISAGMFASVFVDGATVGVFVGRITAVDDSADTITVSTTVKSGTAPSTSASARSIRVGGAWKGPNGTEKFPFDFIAGTLTNAAGDFPRVNLKNGTNYEMTGTLTHAAAGPVTFQGYTATPGDGGRATIHGPTTGTAYIPLSISAQNTCFADLIVENNGLTGSSNGITWTAGEGYLRGIKVMNVRGNGFDIGADSTEVLECEAVGCNQSNTANVGGLKTTSASTTFRRCYSHDNVGSNAVGAFASAAATFDQCIFDSNTLHGLSLTMNTSCLIRDCDFYNNGTDGVRLANTGAAFFGIENCNFVNNGGVGISGTGAGVCNGYIRNCAFGAGTQANDGGNISGTDAMEEVGSITLPVNVTPWVDPANGDFTLELAEVLGAGRGNLPGMESYENVGAVSPEASGGSGGGFF